MMTQILLMGLAFGLFFVVVIGGGCGLSKFVQKLGINEMWLMVPIFFFITLTAMCVIGAMMATQERHEKKMSELRQP